MTKMTESRSCFARMLDLRGMIIAARQGMAGADNSTALAMLAVFSIIFCALLPVWIAFDLSSTWEFTTTIREGATPVVERMAPEAQNILGMSLGALLVGLVLTSFTLLPSLFELAFPSINHPLLNTILHASILFDYITDWPKAWAATEGWAVNPPVRFVYTIIFTLFMSIGIQALLVFCLTVMTFGVLTIVRGPLPMKPMVIDQQQ